MVSHRFGIDVDPDIYINEALTNLNGIKPIDANQVLIGLYETHFGIFDHTDPAKAKENPLALVTLHECEENCKTSNIYELVKLFITKDVHKKLGISLTEFLALPKEYVNLIFELLTEEITKESKLIDNIVSSTKK